MNSVTDLAVLPPGLASFRGATLSPVQVAQDPSTGSGVGIVFMPSVILKETLNHKTLNPKVIKTSAFVQFYSGDSIHLSTPNVSTKNMVFSSSLSMLDEMNSNFRVVTQAKSIHSLLCATVSDRDCMGLPALHFSSDDESNEILLEWIIPDRRFGIFFGPNPEDSSWFLVRNYGNWSRGGLIHEADISRIVMAFIRDEDV